MPILEKPRHEEFAVAIVSGLSPTKAYVKAGYSPQGARQGAHHLLNNLDVSARVLELRMQMSNQVVAGLVATEVANKNARMAELQQRWDWLRDSLECLTEERGAALADEAPGGGTGLLLKRYSQGQPVYMIDKRVLELIRLLLKHEKRAAEELGQWGEQASVRCRQRHRLTVTNRRDLAEQLHPQHTRHGIPLTLP